MKQIQLELTLDEVNLLLEAMGQMPYVRVYQLVQKIQQQAASQLNNNPLSESEGKG